MHETTVGRLPTRKSAHRSIVKGIMAAAALMYSGASQAAVYWNVFNVEGESSASAAFVTYGSLSDMMADTNRLNVVAPGGLFTPNIVGGDSDGSTYWNVFNIEGESSGSAAFVTYGSLSDMMTDTNRLSVVVPSGLFSPNIVDSGFDGSTYWNVFNIEGESSASAAFVTYGSLSDMMTDTNRLNVVAPGGLFSPNIVGSGSDGSTYWNVFNIEGESSASAAFVTYGSLSDMMADTNRLSVVAPGGLFSSNIVGGGFDFYAVPAAIPEPSTWLAMLFGFGAIGVAIRRRRIPTFRRQTA